MWCKHLSYYICLYGWEYSYTYTTIYFFNSSAIYKRIMSKKYSILLVEDDEYIGPAYKLALENAGYDVVITVDGGKALKQIIEKKPDLVLLDIMMPEMDGFEVLEALEFNGNYKDLPIIMCTNLSQESDREKSLKLGASGYLVKGEVSLQELISLVEKTLKEHNL